MLSKILLAWALMAVCVAIHAFGLTFAIRWVRRRASFMDGNLLVATWMLIRVAGWVLILHLLEISLWAFVYDWVQSLPDLDTAFYFSAVTYTTTGYGDIVLPDAWRMVGAVEALTGILMCGWSTAFFFTVVSHRGQVPSQPSGAIAKP